MRISGNRGLMGVACLGLAFFASPAAAHHAVNAQFNPDAESSFTGTLKVFENRQPHCYWTFLQEKTSKEWKFEGQSPATLRRAGIRLKDDIVVGKVYTIYYRPSRDGSNIGNLQAIVINGKRLNTALEYEPPK